MFGIGGASKYSVLRGQKAYQDSNRVFTNTVYAAGLLSVIFVLLGVFASNKITVLLGADNEVFDMTKTYLSVLLYFAPAFIMNDVLICFVRNDGNRNCQCRQCLPEVFLILYLTISLYIHLVWVYSARFWQPVLLR